MHVYSLWLELLVPRWRSSVKVRYIWRSLFLAVMPIFHLKIFQWNSSNHSWISVPKCIAIVILTPYHNFFYKWDILCEIGGIDASSKFFWSRSACADLGQNLLPLVHFSVCQIIRVCIHHPYSRTCLCLFLQDYKFDCNTTSDWLKPLPDVKF